MTSRKSRDTSGNRAFMFSEGRMRPDGRTMREVSGRGILTGSQEGWEPRQRQSRMLSTGRVCQCQRECPLGGHRDWRRHALDVGMDCRQTGAGVPRIEHGLAFASRARGSTHIGERIRLTIARRRNKAIDAPAGCQWMAIGTHTKVTNEPTIRAVERRHSASSGLFSVQPIMIGAPPRERSQPFMPI
jgi:hypothetical protein